MDPVSWRWGDGRVTVDGIQAQGYHRVAISGEGTYRAEFWRDGPHSRTGPRYDRLQRNRSPGVEMKLYDPADTESTCLRAELRGGRSGDGSVRQDVRALDDDAVAAAQAAVDDYLRDAGDDAARRAADRFFALLAVDAVLD